jgi:mannosyltransferase OCH1-like enzyme
MNHLLFLSTVSTWRDWRHMFVLKQKNVEKNCVYFRSKTQSKTYGVRNINVDWTVKPLLWFLIRQGTVMKLSFEIALNSS